MGSHRDKQRIMQEAAEAAVRAEEQRQKEQMKTRTEFLRMVLLSEGAAQPQDEKGGSTNG